MKTILSCQHLETYLKTANAFNGVSRFVFGRINIIFSLNSTLETNWNPFYFTCTLLFSCKSKSDNSQLKTDTAAKIDYPFKPKQSLKWQPGDEKNAAIVLDCLKHYLANDMKGAIKNFADTAEFIGDQFYFKGKKIAWQIYWARSAAIWFLFQKPSTDE
jgi:hypothetical protein